MRKRSLVPFLRSGESWQFGNRNGDDEDGERTRKGIELEKLTKTPLDVFEKLFIKIKQ
jgi:hypothetical protein